MRDSLLLDTHIAVWLNSGNPSLRHATRSLIDQCWQKGGTILLSSISAWEIAMLVHNGKLQLDTPTDRWVERFLDRPGIEGVPLNPAVASRSYQMHHLQYRDPADRLLIATAIDLACPLVTYDARILDFAKKFGPQYAFSAHS